MELTSLKSSMPDYAKDIKLNLGKVLSEEGSEGLSLVQLRAIALASSYATKQPTLIAALQQEAHTVLDASTINAAKAAASIMAMNNIYYRFVHLVHDAEISKMPAGLRMNVIANSGVDNITFELMSLAVSSINGCGMCMESHMHHLVKAGVSKQGIQSAIRIAAVIHATAQILTIEELSTKAHAQAA
jgi:lipoyl-dependent peroxiredoxin subunit D